MSQLKVDTISTRAGRAQDSMLGQAKAWVNFNGTGTPGVLAGLNVTSITDHGTGDFRITCTNAFTATTYAFNITSDGTSACSGGRGNSDVAARATTSFRLYTLDPTTGVLDAASTMVPVFGTLA